MKIPNKIKIGGVIYKVIIIDNWFDRNDADGEVFYDKKKGNSIFLGSNLSKEAREITFIHEALHCMNTTMNHEFLDSLSEQLYQFLSDNKLLK